MGYSLHHVKSRPAKVGDKLRTVNFNTGTRGFAAPEDSTTAVCILPGTELAFSEEVLRRQLRPTPLRARGPSCEPIRWLFPYRLHMQGNSARFPVFPWNRKS